MEQQVAIAGKLWSLKNALETVAGGRETADSQLTDALQKRYAELEAQLDWRCKRILEGHEAMKARYAAPEYVYHVRDKEVRVKTYTESLSHTRIPRVAFPKFKDWGEILRWRLQENVPGEFPYTAGVFPFKREGEDPTRMFAGEGGPERTNKRFHYVSQGLPAARLSTAFDSVTLYGEDPDYRPDIYGKIGNSGVSGLLPRRRQKTLLRLRPLRPENLGVDDHQRSGSDHCGIFYERRHRPAVREIHPGTRPGTWPWRPN
jgi:methylmalonyl-CoA mutase